MPRRLLAVSLLAGLAACSTAAGSGTETSARILGHDAELGTVARGKLADLLLLEPGADPSADIRATRRIRLVILGGRPIEREALRKRPTGGLTD